MGTKGKGGGDDGDEAEAIGDPHIINNIGVHPELANMTLP